MKLFLFRLGLMHASGVPDPIPVVGYLVQTGGHNILIDSGFPQSFAGQSIQLPGGNTIEVAPQDFVVNRLASVGVTPADVNTVICSHLDADHAGGHAAFENAEFIVQKTNYEVALTSDEPRFASLRAEWNRPQLRYRLVEGDTELVPGIELIESSGHVPGHQAVLVRLPQTGPVLLAIDAIPHSSMTDADSRLIMAGYDMDEASTRHSTAKLAELAVREGVTLMIYGHDAGQWATLKQAPECYD